MKKIFTICLLLIITVGNQLSAFEKDGIYYAVNPQKAGTVYVCRSDSYFGHIVIPPTVTYGGKTYSVTEIEEEAFAKCKRLFSISIPNSISEIPIGAFAGCTGLDYVELPNTIKTIGQGAFYQTNITSITLPSSLVAIHSNAFKDCRKLSEISIPKSVKELGLSVFYNYRRLKKVSFEDAYQPLKILSSGNEKTWIFYNCPIEEVFLGRRIVYLGRNYNIFSETEGDYVNINLYDDMRSETKIQNVRILRLGKVIPNYKSSFKHEFDSELKRFYGLQEIHVYRSNPPIIDEHTFEHLKEKCTLYVPVGAKEQYEVAAGWDVFYNIIEESSNYTSTNNVSSAHNDSDAENINQHSAVDETVYKIKDIDVPPQYIDGISGLFSYVKTETDSFMKKYGKFQGRIIVQFVVEADGSISNIEIVEGINEKVDGKICEIIESTSGKWQAGEKNGRQVRSIFAAPLKFH